MVAFQEAEPDHVQRKILSRIGDGLVAVVKFPAHNFGEMKSLMFIALLLLSVSILAFAEEKVTPPPRVYPVALPNYDEETATRLQIFLDNSDFGPGKIDGKMGEFFRKALISYKHAHAMPKTGAVDSWLLDQVPETYTRCSSLSPSVIMPRSLIFRS